MRVLRPVVGPASHLLFAGVTKLSHRSFVRGETIGGDFIGGAVPFQRLLHEPQRGLLVSCLGDVALEYLSLLIHRTPQVMQLSIDLYVNLVEVPFPLSETPRPTYPLALDIGCKERTEPVPPKSHRLVANINPALGQQVLYIPQTQRKPHIHHHNQADDLRRRVEIAKRTGWFARSGHRNALAD